MIVNISRAMFIKNLYQFILSRSQSTMKSIIINIFLIVICSPMNYAAKSEAYLEPSSISTQIGASYVAMLKHNTIAPIECYIHDIKKNLTYNVDLYQQGITPVLQSDTHIYSPVQPKADVNDSITSLGNGICGFKMDSVSQNTVVNWNISMIDQNQIVYWGQLSVIRRPVFPRLVTKYVQPGQELFINCANREAGDILSDLLTCEVLTPQNKRIKIHVGIGDLGCNYEVKAAKVSDFGKWRCLQTFKSHMMPTEVIYEFIPIELDVVQTWINTTDNHLNIGCKVINATEFMEYCAMVKPDGNKIALQSGLATKRYTAIGTNITEHICSMQIELPLEETEKGVWRCEQWNKVYLGSPIGGFINVSLADSKYKPEVKLPTEVFAHINATLKMTCAVPYSVPYCYMRGPDGLMYPLNDDRKNNLGLCEFTKKEAQITDNGTWICGFGKQTGEPDDVYTFQVFIPEPIPIKPELQEIESRTAGTARLKCSTRGLGDYPLKYCRFLSPDGKMYQIHNHQTSDRMSYEGRGLEYGDCGVVLQDVTESDQGIWSCITRIQQVNVLGKFDDTEEVYTNMHLTINDNLSIASTLGISFGVVAVVIITAVFLIHRYQKRRNYQTRFDETNRRTSQLSNNSAQNDIVFNVLQDNRGNRNYNTSDVVVRPASETVNNPFERSESQSSENNSVIFDMTDDRDCTRH